MKYFGIGLHKTGTTTLGRYLQACGFNHHVGGDVRLTAAVKRKDFRPILDRVNRFDSFEDAPWFLLYRQLWEQFPNAKFVLTVRSSPQLWLSSMEQHVKRFGPQYPLRQVYGFPTPIGHEEHFLDYYDRHNREVAQFFADKPGRLLTLCFESPEAKSTLLGFLDRSTLEIPDIHANKRDSSVHKQSVKSKARSLAVYLARIALEKTRLPMR